MTNAEHQDLLEKLRSYIFRLGIKNFNIDNACNHLNITKERYYLFFLDERDMVDQILDFERKSFEYIFDKYDFDGMNAIDILITVSIEINKRFKNVSPALTFDLQLQYPDIYQKHISNRASFIFEKIKVNLDKGMRQNMYRKDASIELIARSYIAKLLDIHDPKVFPHEEFTFDMLFNIMIDKFIVSIANEEGLEYYKKRKQLYNVLKLSSNK